MIIYKDVFSGDEMISDAFDMKLVDDVVYEVDCKMVTVKKGADVDIGANASAEEAADDLEDGSETVNNIVHSFRLVPTNFEKKDYLDFLKNYMKRVKGYLLENGSSAEEIGKFEAGAKKFAGSSLKSFSDWEFYIGESMEVTGMVALLNFREDGSTPYMVFWKHGLKEEKV